MLSQKFYNALRIGNGFEAFVLQKVKQKYPLATQRGNGKEWDIFVPETIDYLECKSDLSSKRTGNFFIEYENVDGTPSGIALTKATFWALGFWYKQYIAILIKSEDLRSAVSRYETCKGNENSWGYIVPCGDLLLHPQITVIYRSDDCWLNS
jgi:hypothetical protein